MNVVHHINGRDIQVSFETDGQPLSWTAEPLRGMMPKLLEVAQNLGARNSTLLGTTVMTYHFADASAALAAEAKLLEYFRLAVAQYR